LRKISPPRKSDPDRDVKRYAAQAEKYGVDIDRTKAKQRRDDDRWDCTRKLAEWGNSLFNWTVVLSLRKTTEMFLSLYNRGLISNIKSIITTPFSLFKSAQCTTAEFAFNFQEIDLIDRHVLYKPWRLVEPNEDSATVSLEGSEEEGKEKIENEVNPPILVKSVRDFNSNPGQNRDKATQ